MKFCPKPLEDAQVKPNIAIDGPAGAGKSTVARKLAEQLNYLYIDTGAMYRAVAYYALERGVDLDDQEQLSRLAGEIEVSLAYDSDRRLKVFCNGVEISDKIRTQAVSQSVSKVAKVPAVRVRLVELQRRMAAGGGVVMDGRDIGSVVLPDAQLKFFITASIEQRTRRRLKELKEQGCPVNFDELKAEILQRDKIDSSRENSPLVRVPDAILVDTSDMTIEEVVREILNISRKRLGEDV